MRGFAWILALVLFGSPAQAMVWPNTIERVAAELNSADVGARRAAAAALSELPASAARRLLPVALADVDAQVRIAAAEVAIQMRFEPSVPVARSWLSDGDSAVRQVAAQLLGEFPLQSDTLVSLGRALADPQADVRLAAAQALGASRSLTATLPLLGHLDDSNPPVQIAVIEALERLRDQRSVMPLVGKIQDPRSGVRRAVVRALGALGGQRVTAGLVLALRDNDSKVRVAAARALGKTQGISAVDALAGILADDADPDVQVAALFSLSEHNTAKTASLVIGAIDSRRSEVAAAARQALQEFGAAARPALRACLESPRSRATADGCVKGIAHGAGPGAYELVLAAWQQKAVSPSAALGAMKHLADPRALPIALEALSNTRPDVRRHALELATALLDPESPDGRAVEPLVQILGSLGDNAEERIAVVTLLGRTGTPRAARHVVSFAEPGAARRLRVAALRALGLMRAKQYADTMMQALSDRSARVRREAALALRRSGPTGLARPLLAQMKHAAQQDRMALAIALGGALAGSSDEQLLARVRALALTSAGNIQDPLIEALGYGAPEAALPTLRSLSKHASPDVRAKVAEVLAGFDESSRLLLQLLKDVDARVRSNAAWSLGVVGQKDAVAALHAAFKDSQLAVLANAAAALARISVRNSMGQPSELCSLLEHTRSYVRANALVGLRLMNVRCDPAGERWTLQHDPSAIVRQRAAELISAVPSGESAADSRALETCLSEEPQGAVAAACLSDGAVRRKAQGRRGTLTVFTAEAYGGGPVARSPYALEFADRLMRIGISDRRGAVFSRGVPRGSVRLRLPHASAD